MKRAFFMVALLVAGLAQAAGQINAASQAAFDVATVRLHDPAPHERSHIFSSDRDGNFSTQNVSLLAIVQYAFRIPDSRIM